MLYGYARVSTDGQSLNTQIEELRSAGCKKIFREKASGSSRSQRLELEKLIRTITVGDVLVVTRLDRLARSSRDLLNVLAEVGAKNSSFRSLRDPWADTTTPHGRLMLTVLGGLAEFERSLISSRTAEGRLRAKQSGVRFGRKPVLTVHQRKEALSRRSQGEPLVSIARSYNVSHSTISRLKTPVSRIS